MEERRAGTSVFSQKREEMSQTVTHGQDLAGQRVEKGDVWGLLTVCLLLPQVAQLLIEGVKPCPKL